MQIYIYMFVDIYMKPNHITYILKTLHCLPSCLKDEIKLSQQWR